MLQYEPSHRPTMTEVMAHPWIQKRAMSRNEIKQSFKERRDVINEAKIQRKQSQEAERDKRYGERRSAIANRSLAAQLQGQQDAMQLDTSDEALSKP